MLHKLRIIYSQYGFVELLMRLGSVIGARDLMGDVQNPNFNCDFVVN